MFLKFEILSENNLNNMCVDFVGFIKNKYCFVFFVVSFLEFFGSGEDGKG